VCGIESLGLVQVTPWSSVVPAGEFESCVAEIEAGDSGRGSPLSLGIEMKKKIKKVVERLSHPNTSPAQFS
jgi:hypothetical protein